MGIFVDSDSQIYIVDSDNHCIRKMDQNGMVSTFQDHQVNMDIQVMFHLILYPHVGPRKKPLIKPFPKAYHDIVIYSNSTTWTEYEPLSKKTKFD